MAKIPYHNYEQIQPVHNRLSNNKYIIFIPDCPDAGNMSDFSIRCESVSLPLGEKVNMNEVIINGFPSRKSTGDTIHPSEFSVTLIEDEKNSVRRRLKKWKEFTAGTLSGGVSVSDASYKRDIQVHIYNDACEHVTQYVVKGCFPTELNDISLKSGTSPDVIKVEVKFTIDRTAFEDGEPLK